MIHNTEITKILQECQSNIIKLISHKLAGYRQNWTKDSGVQLRKKPNIKLQPKTKRERDEAKNTYETGTGLDT